MLLPNGWMQAIHSRIGLGEMPQAPIVEYLARSTSAFYGYHGVLALVASTNVRRLRTIVRFIGWMSLTFGAILLGIDWSAGLPAAWTLLEGPSAALLGIVVLLLVRNLDREQPSAVVDSGSR
jgi:hypothetical protein